MFSAWTFCLISLLQLVLFTMLYITMDVFVKRNYSQYLYICNERMNSLPNLDVMKMNVLNQVIFHLLFLVFINFS